MVKGDLKRQPREQPVHIGASQKEDSRRGFYRKMKLVRPLIYLSILSTGLIKTLMMSLRLN